MHEVLVNRLGGLSLPRKSVVRLTDRPDMTLDVYRGRKTTMQNATYAFDKRCCILKHHIAPHIFLLHTGPAHNWSPTSCLGQVSRLVPASWRRERFWNSPEVCKENRHV